MAAQDTDLLLVQRGSTPFKATVETLSNKIRGDINTSTDIAVASASQLGVIRVGNNLAIDGNGILEAVIPAGLEYMGVLTDPTAPPTGTAAGQFWVWDGVGGVTLNNVGWGTANGETVDVGDRLIWDGSTFDIVPGGGGGIVSVTGTAPIQVDSSNADHPDVSVDYASATQPGVITSAEWSKLDGIEPGAEVNVNPTSTFAVTNNNGTLTLQPGGDTTAFPVATGTEAGLMSAADKTVLDNLVSSPGGVLSLVAGDGIVVNTATAPGSAGTPEVIVNFGSTPGGTATTVMPYDISLLGLLN